jgi:hypothetical protein
MHSQAILTHYIRPSPSKGTRVRAKAFAGSLTASWDHALDDNENHTAAAKALATKFSWRGNWAGGRIAGGFAFVLVNDKPVTELRDFEPVFSID